jgi:hypothetical protein
MKVIIAGSRTFDNYEELEKVCDRLLINQTEIEIISGDGNGGFVNGKKVHGADQLGIQYAESRSYKVTKFPANWDMYGKSAGPKRNLLMTVYAAGEENGLIAFWDKKSRGTKNMIELAKQYKLRVKIHKI